MGEMTMVERVADAIEKAHCPHREGPFGGYDYGYPDDREVKGGRYVVRDFRDPKSPDWGKWLFQSDDREEYERALKRMTWQHIARAAIEAMREPTDAMKTAFVDQALRGDVLSHGGWPGYAADQWRIMIDAVLKSDG